LQPYPQVAAIVADKTARSGAGALPTSVRKLEIMSLPASALGIGLGRGAFRSYPNHAPSPLAARHVKPASSRLGWASVGCAAWLVPDRPTLLAPTKDALAITPASTRRTHIFVVTGRDL